MSSSVTLLLATDDTAVTDLFRDAAVRDPSVRVESTADGIAMIELAREIHPDAIICAASLGGLEGLELCRRMKQDPDLRSAQFLLLTPSGASKLKMSGLEAGVDDFVATPLESAEVLALMRSLVRSKKLLDRMRRIELRSANAREHFDQVVNLLVQLIDFSLPGAAARGEAIADLGRKIANRFEIPEHLLRDLEIAARLQEIGKVVPRDGASEPVDNAPSSDGPTYCIASTAIMHQIEWLHPAADIVTSISENWDGTGLPARLHKGQIPLRSRILRILIDFLEQMVGPEPQVPQEVAAALAEHTGTRYDPVVVVHFRTVIGDTPDRDWTDTRVLVPVTELKAGMVLAEDLFTSSGIKLLRSGATVSTAMLDAIQRRHHVDPILDGAWVQRNGS